MNFCLQYNSKPFGSQTFETHGAAAKFLRELLEEADKRYQAAIRTQNTALVRSLRIIRRRLLSDIQIVPSTAVVQNSDESKNVSYHTHDNIERPRYSSRIRSYAMD